MANARGPMASGRTFPCVTRDRSPKCVRTLEQAAPSRDSAFSIDEVGRPVWDIGVLEDGLLRIVSRRRDTKQFVSHVSRCVRHKRPRDRSLDSSPKRCAVSFVHDSSP